MKYREYDLHRRKPGFLVDPHRDPPSVILNCHGIVFIDRYEYSITESCQRLIHSIIHNLIYQMMESPR